MRLSRFAVLASLALVSAACSDDDGGPTTPNIPPLAYVRYINAVPDTSNTTVRFIDQVEFSPMTFTNVPFRSQGQGGYQGTEAKARKFRVFTADFVDFTPAGNTVILVDTTITFEAGKYYTLLHTGYARASGTPKQRIVVIEDQIPSPGTSIAIRAINAQPGAATDVYLTPTATTAISGTPAMANLAYLAASPYRTQAPAAFAAQITAAGATTSLGGAAAPAGSAAANGQTAAAGATIAGSALTAVAFPASVAGSKAAQFAAPGVAFFLDNRPAS